MGFGDRRFHSLGTAQKPSQAPKQQKTAVELGIPSFDSAAPSAALSASASQEKKANKGKQEDGEATRQLIAPRRAARRKDANRYGRDSQGHDEIPKRAFFFAGLHPKGTETQFR